jgi:hypothetical protein
MPWMAWMAWSSLRMMAQRACIFFKTIILKQMVDIELISDSHQGGHVQGLADVLVACLANVEIRLLRLHPNLQIYRIACQI